MNKMDQMCDKIDQMCPTNGLVIFIVIIVIIWAIVSNDKTPE